MDTDVRSNIEPVQYVHMKANWEGKLANDTGLESIEVKMLGDDGEDQIFLALSPTAKADVLKTRNIPVAMLKKHSQETINELLAKKNNIGVSEKHLVVKDGEILGVVNAENEHINHARMMELIVQELGSFEVGFCGVSEEDLVIQVCAAPVYMDVSVAFTHVIPCVVIRASQIERGAFEIDSCLQIGNVGFLRSRPAGTAVDRIKYSKLNEEKLLEVLKQTRERLQKSSETPTQERVSNYMFLLRDVRLSKIMNNDVVTKRFVVKAKRILRKKKMKLEEVTQLAESIQSLDASIRDTALGLLLGIVHTAEGLDDSKGEKLQVLAGLYLAETLQEEANGESNGE